MQFYTDLLWAFDTMRTIASAITAIMSRVCWQTAVNLRAVLPAWSLKSRQNLISWQAIPSEVFGSVSQLCIHRVRKRLYPFFIFF